MPVAELKRLISKLDEDDYATVVRLVLDLSGKAADSARPDISKRIGIASACRRRLSWHCLGAQKPPCQLLS